VRSCDDPEAIPPGELASAYAKFGWRMSPLALWGSAAGEMEAGRSARRRRGRDRRGSAPSPARSSLESPSRRIGGGLFLDTRPAKIGAAGGSSFLTDRLVAKWR
jgi:hypothetical protein